MYADECKAIPNGYKETIENAKKETREVVNDAYAELEKQSLRSKALKIAKESLQKEENKLAAIKHIFEECGHSTYDNDKNGFSLKQAKDIVDEAHIELLHQTPDIAHIDFSKVRQDMDLYSELLEKIEGLEAQMRLITNIYPYIVFPRYAREPSQPTTQKA